MASPYLCRPTSHGADIVLHSATKFWAATAPPSAAYHRQRQVSWSDSSPRSPSPPRLPRHEVRPRSSAAWPSSSRARVEACAISALHQPLQLVLFIQGIETLIPHGPAQPHALAGPMARNEPRRFVVEVPGLNSALLRAGAKYLPRAGRHPDVGIRGLAAGSQAHRFGEALFATSPPRRRQEPDHHPARPPTSN